MDAAARALTDRLTRYLELPEERKDILAFGLVNLFLYLLDFAALAVAAALSGVPALTVTASFTAMFFRTLTGGAHLSTPWRCLCVSALLVWVCGVGAAWLSEVLGLGAGGVLVAMVGALAAWGIGKYAPVDSPAKPIPPAQAKRLRRAAWTLLAVWGVWEGSLLAGGQLDLALASSLGLIVQIGTLTPGEARLSHWIDNRLDLVQRLSIKGVN